MKIEQIYTGCLAQGAYYISSNGEAAIIDPLRDTQPYLDRLAADETTLKYIFETHFHADFVSGHLDLSERTNAPIVFGPNANPDFKSIIAQDEQVFELGDLKIKVLHTPGHTLESSCYLLSDKSGKELALFSGDTLFLGDVGRPDLAQKAESISEEDLAGMLYDSLQHKILPLSNDVVVYPAHGAGSACGKSMMKETVDTLGNQKKVNYALNQPDKSSFIAAVTDGLLPPPGYFAMNVSMNRKGYESFDKVLTKGAKSLEVHEFEALAEVSGALVLDTRANALFAQGFIPNSINIGLAGDFAPWVGAMIVNVAQPILLITESGSEEETIIRLARVGFDNVLGYLQGGFDSWKQAGREVDKVNRISATQFDSVFEPGKSKVLDLRKEAEYEAEHVKDAYNRPLAYINEWFTKLDPKEHVFLHCAGGYRSMIAASILQARGFRNFTEIEGGFAAISKTNVPKSNFICQSRIVI